MNGAGFVWEIIRSMLKLISHVQIINHQIQWIKRKLKLRNSAIIRIGI